MQLKNIKQWVIKPELEGFLFFAQRIDELLFQYSLDTYKPSCLNSPFLAREAIAVAEDVENEFKKHTGIKNRYNFIIFI